MPAFEYTGPNLDELERKLSTDRLHPYRTAVGGNLEQAVRLYEQNSLLAESLYGILQGLEVALRNTIHAQLASGFGRPEWWDTLQLGPEQDSMVRKAKDALKREEKRPDAGRVVAELAFGFWTGLTSARYEALWRDHLAKIVPSRWLQRVQLHNRLNSIRKLCNRVAHHEPILNRPLQKEANQIFDTISWISPITARWVRSNSSFEERFAVYRERFPKVGAR
jgi:Abi-like protein